MREKEGENKNLVTKKTQTSHQVLIQSIEEGESLSVRGGFIAFV